jgi:hypothetical protein
MWKFEEADSLNRENSIRLTGKEEIMLQNGKKWKNKEKRMINQKNEKKSNKMKLQEKMKN